MSIDLLYSMEKIRNVSEKFRGKAVLYKTDNVVTAETYSGEIESQYWVVSSVKSSNINETMIFPSDENGNVDEYIDVECVRPNNEKKAVEYFEEEYCS